jgi:hypothetical protein
VDHDVSRRQLIVIAVVLAWLSLAPAMVLAAVAQTVHRRRHPLIAIECPACDGYGWAGDDETDACGLCDGDTVMQVCA